MKPNRQDTQVNTELHNAISKGDLDLVKSLLKGKADPRIENNPSGMQQISGWKKCNALVFAIGYVAEPSLPIVTTIIAHAKGNKITLDYSDALKTAIEKNKISCVRTLLEIVDIKSIPSALKDAIAANNLVAVEIILKNPGFKLTDLDKNDRIKLLFLAASNGNINLVRDLIALNPENINAQSKEGTSLLHVAVENRQDEMLVKLLELKAAPNQQNSQNHTALDLAIHMVSGRGSQHTKDKNIHLVEILLKNKEIVLPTDDSEKLKEMLAAVSNHPELFTMIWNHKNHERDKEAHEVLTQEDLTDLLKKAQENAKMVPLNTAVKTDVIGVIEAVVEPHVEFHTDVESTNAPVIKGR